MTSTPPRRDDFVALVHTLIPLLEAHEVPEQLRDSLLEDIVFSVASFIDTHTGSRFHESVFEMLESAAARPAAFRDRLLAVGRLRFKRGKPREFNLLASMLDSSGELGLVLELNLGLRQLHQIDADIDTKPGFQALLDRRNGLVAFELARNWDESERVWQAIPAPSGLAEIDSIEALCSHIRSAFVPAP